MDKFHKSQILKLFLMAILLSITPLLSTPLRPPYLYFVVNILIIALGVEAGLLSFIGKTAEDKKTSSNTVLSSEDSSSAPNKEKSASTTSEAETTAKKKPKAVEKSSSEKIVSSSTAAKVHKVVKKSPSMPSLFFIGGAESTIDQVEELIEEEEDFDDDGGGKQEAPLGDEISGQELFHKAETFIGNFYKQLKMQREDSWKKIHGFYQKAF